MPHQPSKFNYDDECEVLARHFTADIRCGVGKSYERGATELDRQHLAQHIQDCIEDWLSSFEEGLVL